MAALRLRLTLPTLLLLLASCGGLPKSVPEPPGCPSPSSVPSIRAEGMGVGVRAFAQGPEDADILILGIHGWGASGAEWLVFGEALEGEARRAAETGAAAPTVRLLSPDLPGSGASERPDAPYTPEWFVGVLEGIRESQGRDRMVVAGHSLGGRLALEYALAYPERVSALILFAPAGLEDSFYPLDRWVLRRGRLIRSGTKMVTERLYMRFYRRRVVRDPRYAYPEIARWAISGLLTEEGRRALAAVTRNALAAPDLTERLDEIEVPVLLIWGRGDEVLKFESSRDYLERLPELRGFLALDGCGHLPQTERASETARAVYAFLEGLKAGGTCPP